MRQLRRARQYSRSARSSQAQRRQEQTAEPCPFDEIRDRRQHGTARTTRPARRRPTAASTARAPALQPRARGRRRSLAPRTKARGGAETRQRPQAEGAASSQVGRWPSRPSTRRPARWPPAADKAGSDAGLPAPRPTCLPGSASRTVAARAIEPPRRRTARGSPPRDPPERARGRRRAGRPSPRAPLANSRPSSAAAASARS